MPIQNDYALGPPTGLGPYSRNDDDITVLGINGSAAWRFQLGYYIYNGPGADFRTFEGSFAWNMEVNGLCCELAHVEVSEDGVIWYKNNAEQFDINPSPAVNNANYVYANVKNMHGNEPTWANYRQDIQAHKIEGGKWVDIPGVKVLKSFSAVTENLGGVAFDLDHFIAKAGGTPWPAGGKMRYIRIIDDTAVLDGQDYDKAWCLGAQMQSAMGIHFKKDGE